MSVTDILVDFAIASFFIAVGQLLRAKVPLVQKFFIPPSMIAGFIADGLVEPAAALRGRLVLTLKGRLLADTVTRKLWDAQNL